MAADGSIAVVVLPVDVCSNRAAHADMPRPRGYGKEEAARDDIFENLRERGTRLAYDFARILIPVADSIESVRQENTAVLVQGSIAVAAAPATGNEAALLTVFENQANFIQVARAIDVTLLDREVAPSGEPGRFGARYVYHFAAAAMIARRARPTR